MSLTKERGFRATFSLPSEPPWGLGRSNRVQGRFKFLRILPAYKTEPSAIEDDVILQEVSSEVAAELNILEASNAGIEGSRN